MPISAKNKAMWTTIVSIVVKTSLLIVLIDIHTVHAEKLSFSSNDTVNVSAENAWEGDVEDVVHFEGKFELRAPDWTLSADSAVVYGQLDNPDKIILKGSPARIYFLREKHKENEQKQKEQSVEGSAFLIEYMRASNKLKMSGSARLTRDANTLAGEIIEYDIDADRYSASGEGGINIQVTPGK